MKLAGNDDDFLLGNLINQSVFLGNSPSPEALQVMLQRLRLAEA